MRTDEARPLPAPALCGRALPIALSLVLLSCVRAPGAGSGGPSLEDPAAGPPDAATETPGTGSGGPGADPSAPAAGTGGPGGGSADASPPTPDEPEAPPTCPAGPSATGAPPNGTVPDALSFPSPTLRNASVQWLVRGDDNANGVVTVRFRRVGEARWRRGLPLRRVPAGSNQGVSWANRHAGSLFDLEPGTRYEVEAFLLDPDGGCALSTGTFSTRPVPAAMPGAPVKAVTPSTLSQALASAQPGDVLDLAPGTYPGLSVPVSGELGKPIVIRGQAGAVIGGETELSGRKHLIVTGLTLRGRVRLNSSVDVAVVRNTVETTGNGIAATLRSENAYIADNTVVGASAWTVDAIGASGNNVGEGIVVTGPGHVIEHNRVRGFRDCLSLNEGAEAVEQHGVDFVENEVSECGDDGVEADFCLHDCRVVRNRFTNTFNAMSSQPGLGGPTYFIRNVGYNHVQTPFKLHNGSIGDVMLHNTIVKNGDALGIYAAVPFRNQYARNNLFIGGPGGTYASYATGPGRVIEMPAADPSGDYDYDAYGSTASLFMGRLGGVSFASLAELRARTTERHAVQVGLDVFAVPVSYPASPFPALPAPDLRLKATAAAIDAGVVLPNVNDAFSGKGPDLGAYELGAAMPAYGPR